MSLRICLFTLLFCSRVFADPLVVGMELSDPPFEMKDAEGKPAGVSVDLATALANYLNRPLQINDLPYAALLSSLQTGKIDCIIASLTITPERERVIIFSDPYLRTGLCLLISQQSNVTDIHNADERGRVVTVKNGSIGQIYAEKNLRKAKILILAQESDCVAAVVKGSADAFIYDQFATYTNWQANPKTTRANLDPFTVEYWAIGMRKGDTDLLEKTNSFLKEFKAQGGLEKLGDKYLKTQKEAFKKLGLPFLFFEME